MTKPRRAHGPRWAAPDARRKPLRVSAVGTLAALLLLLLLVPTLTRAASPSPNAGVVGDPRSSGQGPGLVGDAGTAILATLGVGVGAVIVTSMYVRLIPRRLPDDS